jgi:hypothetical protein
MTLLSQKAARFALSVVNLHRHMFSGASVKIDACRPPLVETHLVYVSSETFAASRSHRKRGQTGGV